MEDPAALVVRPLNLETINGKPSVKVFVKNYGLQESSKATVRIILDAKNAESEVMAELPIPSLKPYDSHEISLPLPKTYPVNAADYRAEISK